MQSIQDKRTLRVFWDFLRIILADFPEQTYNKKVSLREKQNRSAKLWNYGTFMMKINSRPDEQ